MSFCLARHLIFVLPLNLVPGVLSISAYIPFPLSLIQLGTEVYQAGIQLSLTSSSASHLCSSSHLQIVPSSFPNIGSLMLHLSSMSCCFICWDFSTCISPPHLNLENSWLNIYFKLKCSTEKCTVWSRLTHLVKIYKTENVLEWKLLADM